MIKTVKVNTKQRNYDIIIGSNILDETGKYIKKIKSKCKAVIISDNNVAPLYAQRVITSLNKENFECYLFTFEPGEKSKNITTYSQILNFCAEKKLSRSDLIIALGGGVTGDLSGFVSATFLRGIEYIQIPTSLLACVDSSVGGKTAIDLPQGKNLAGAFYQPSLVLIDTEVLKTLPDEFFKDGMAEVIKYGFINNKSLLEMLKKGATEENITDIIEACVKMKAEIVAEDELDKGCRQLLNFGHTVGHSIEKYSAYTIHHGNCVAIGMCIIAKAVANSGLGKDITNELFSLLKQYKLPTECEYNSKALMEISHSDKKIYGDTITIVIPTEYGKCELKKISLQELDEIIKSGI